MQYANMEQEYKKPGCPKKQDVAALMEWQRMQPHLPKISELQTALFLHSCYGSNEAAKQCIDNYYTCRTHCPEFLSQRDPNRKEVQLILDNIAIVPLPKLTPKGELVFYARLINCSHDVYNFNAALKVADMVFDLSLSERGCLEGQILILDLEGCTLMHLLKSSVLSVQKGFYYLQEALPFRLKSCHCVNAVPFMDKIMALAKPFMKKKLQDNLQVHYGDNLTILKFVPKECLPKECGGDCGSVYDHHAKNRKHLEANAKFFLDDEKNVVDESKRPGKPKNAGHLFGVEGTFKKLEID